MSGKNKKEKFSFNTINDFDDHIFHSIPRYDVLLEQVINFGEYFIKDKTNVYDLGCSTGKLLKFLDKKYKAKYIGIDNTDNLLPKSKDGIAFLNVNLEEDYIFNNSSFVVSMFTLQFLDPKIRLDLLKRIYNGLNKGGAFILTEKVFSSNSQIQDIFIFQYYDFKRNSFEYDDIMNKEKDLRSFMQPLTREENMEMLKEAGFKKIDLFWKHYNFEGILCIK